MATRNISEEILELKKRSEFDSLRELSKKFKQIKDALNNIPNNEAISSSELRKYIPVALISTMESFFRSSVKKIIEKDEIYFNNSKSLFENNNIKINFDILNHIYKKNFTIGEFISHQLSFSRYDQIDNCFSKIINIEFIKTLKKYKTTNIFPGKQNNSALYIEKNVSITADIIELYKIRNIICHEMSLDINLSKENIERLFDSAFIFTNQVHNYVYDLLYPEINDKIEAKKHKELFQKAEQDLNLLIERIKKNNYTYFGVKANLNTFIESHTYWENYRNSYVTSIMYGIEGNSLYESMYYEEMYDITIDRIEDLKIDFDNEAYI